MLTRIGKIIRQYLSPEEIAMAMVLGSIMVMFAALTAFAYIIFTGGK